VSSVFLSVKSVIAIPLSDRAIAERKIIPSILHHVILNLRKLINPFFNSKTAVFLRSDLFPLDSRTYVLHTVGMEEERALNAAPAPLAGLAALYGPDAVPLALALTAQIALQRPVWVVDGGNRFDALWVAEYIARSGKPPEAILARIHVSRAFTCHQMAERILSLPAPGPEAGAGEAAPLVVLHLLDTFYDENVPLAEARRLLGALWPFLRRRSRSAPVALTLHPPRSERVADRAHFYSEILHRADRRVGPDLPSASPSPLPFPSMEKGNLPRANWRMGPDRIPEDHRGTHPLPLPLLPEQGEEGEESASG
jgi:hypothetical protein